MTAAARVTSATAVGDALARTASWAAQAATLPRASPRATPRASPRPTPRAAAAAAAGEAKAAREEHARAHHSEERAREELVEEVRRMRALLHAPAYRSSLGARAAAELALPSDASDLQQQPDTAAAEVARLRALIHSLAGTADPDLENHGRKLRSGSDGGGSDPAHRRSEEESFDPISR